MCLRDSLELPKEVKQLVVYVVESGMALQPMQENWASCQVDLEYTELFCIPVVTSMSF